MKDYIIKETEYWKIELSFNQAYLGRCVVIAKRKVDSLSNLTNEEWEDFAKLVKLLEFALIKSFGARHFNWTCLMNNAFKAEKYENKKAQPWVHWHCRPRYDKKIEFEGEVFEDSEFAHHYNNERHKEVSEELFNKIKVKIAKELK